MDDKTLQALTALAAKLGTTAEYLWGVLVRQAPISGTIDLITSIVFLAVGVFWFRFVKRKTTCPEKTADERYTHAEWEAEGAFFSWASVFVLCLFAAVIVSCSLQNIAAALFNPEYWALKQILH